MSLLKTSSTNLCRYHWLFVLFAFSFIPRLQASTVLELSFADVVNSAELIFEGRVLSLEVREEAGMFHTYVSFEIMDVIKGEYTDPVVELHFLGGRIGNRQLQITDMIMPRPGEIGVYFVESLQEQLVHPLVGWAQGHFLIEQGFVTSAAHEPLSSVEATPQVIPPNSFSKGIAKGVIVQELHLLQDAMTVAGFKAAILDVFDE